MTDSQLDSYATLKQEGEREIVIRKSRFIGRVRPVATEEEALAFVEAVRKEHASATHNCYAYVVGDRDERQKMSDDGEPSGTAGKPILELIKKRGLQYTAVVVTRYFGGVKLGASGLIRAYAEAAAAGIEAAIPIHQVLHEQVGVKVAYTWQGKLENELRNANTMMGETEFAEEVTFHCLPLASEADAFIAWMTDLTNGQADIIRGERIYIAHRDFKQS